MPHPTITLTEERETLLIPLYGKALESRRDNPILDDQMAENIDARIDYDFGRLRVSRMASITLALRAKKLDTCTREYLAQHEYPLVLHLGCGLDSRVVRVADPRALWYDLDYPDVIDLRRLFYQETAIYHMLATSVSDFRWLDAVAATGPAMIVAEGLLMYLDAEEVGSLLLALRKLFPASQIAFDASPPSTPGWWPDTTRRSGRWEQRSDGGSTTRRRSKAGPGPAAARRMVLHPGGGHRQATGALPAHIQGHRPPASDQARASHLAVPTVILSVSS